eukprot:gnl/TRDRNA2_/TRDRNA2_83159_c0_seq1.p1 gnl/TRDRNA2_/TRDRNA2_83159_c0~~gnl/TRDRNA2_/TRDRNA2_83159_c0_seq1.p1  ORF type:complete len:284 (-),score=11.05 gnl/TRDRNA2_/TRDRNA2_83159_c0_seq1:55-822(-)
MQLSPASCLEIEAEIAGLSGASRRAAAQSGCTAKSACSDNLPALSLHDLHAYVDNLDLWLLSNGGVGSNYLLEFLKQSSNLTVKTNRSLYVETCHTPLLLRSKPRSTLVIWGDWANSIHALWSKGMLLMNARKMHFGRDRDCDKSLETLMQMCANDPFGIFGFLAAHLETDAVFLRYPWTEASLKKAFDQLGLTARVDWGKLKVRRRRPHTDKLPGDVKDAVLAYADAERTIPKHFDVFTKDDVPPELRAILAFH